jgi:Domain of unknown function (DUF4259)
MGAWGLGPFENDDAMDFIADLETTEGTGHLGTIFSTIPDEIDSYVEAPEAAAAIAAAEVVAALLGRANPQQPPEVTQWVARQAGVDSSLFREALRAVRRIQERSELRELWEEGADLPQWEASVSDLVARLRAGART